MKFGVYSTFLIFFAFIFWHKGNVLAIASQFSSEDFVLDYSTISTGAHKSNSEELTVQSGTIKMSANGNSDGFYLRTINLIDGEVEEIDQPEEEQVPGEQPENAVQIEEENNSAGSVFLVSKNQLNNSPDVITQVTKKKQRQFKKVRNFSEVLDIYMPYFAFKNTDSASFYLGNRVQKVAISPRNLVFLHFDYLDSVVDLKWYKKYFKLGYFADFSTAHLLFTFEQFFNFLTTRYEVFEN
jgi:hypothetical protein